MLICFIFSANLNSLTFPVQESLRDALCAPADKEVIPILSFCPKSSLWIQVKTHLPYLKAKFKKCRFGRFRIFFLIPQLPAVNFGSNHFKFSLFFMFLAWLNHSLCISFNELFILSAPASVLAGMKIKDFKIILQLALICMASSAKLTHMMHLYIHGNQSNETNTESNSIWQTFQYIQYFADTKKCAPGCNKLN